MKKLILAKIEKMINKPTHVHTRDGKVIQVNEMVDGKDYALTSNAFLSEENFKKYKESLEEAKPIREVKSLKKGK